MRRNGPLTVNHARGTMNMPPIRFTRAERRSLHNLANVLGRLPHGALPLAHARKFAHHRLLASRHGEYHLTLPGQIEAIRQHFCLLPWDSEPVRFPPPPSQARPGPRLPAFLHRAA